MITPQQETLINKLTAKMGLDMAPEEVPVQIAPYSRVHQCYSNVEEKVNCDGGRIHYGWVIHITNTLCEAERHAVWEDDTEDLYCITPNTDSKDAIIFLSDNRPVDPLDQIDNIRINKTNDPVVDDFIYVCEVVGELWYRFTTRLNDEEVSSPEVVREVIEKYDQFKGLIYGLIKHGRKERSVCFCGSEKKFIHCHSKMLRREVPLELEALETKLIELAIAFRPKLKG